MTVKKTTATKKVGAPTKYRPAMCDQAHDYLAQCKDVYEQIQKSYSQSGESFEYRLAVTLPTIEGFALFLGVSRTTLFSWGDKYPEFLYSLEMLKADQKDRLINMGLSGQYNATTAKLILMSNHGMSEKSEVETSGSYNITISEVESRL